MANSNLTATLIPQHHAMRTLTTAFAFLATSASTLTELPTTTTPVFVAMLYVHQHQDTTVHHPLVCVHLDRPAPLRMDPWPMLNPDASVEWTNRNHAILSLV